MKILSTKQIREADAFTIANKPISSTELMETAAGECFSWIQKNTDKSKLHVVICGTGNNGGDGLVIARKLTEKKIPVEVIILGSQNHSDDFDKNLEALKKKSDHFKILKEGEPISLHTNSIIIDAIFGTGLSRPVNGWIGACIDSINQSGNEIISIDLPSGLFADSHTEGKVIHANDTLTFQTPKLAFFFQENEKFTGRFHVLNIDLDEKFIQEVDAKNIYLSEEEVRHILKPRLKFSHKGSYGHSLLICGSLGKMGAAVIAAKACLRSGTGLLTVHIPGCGYEILQTILPEAMVDIDIEKNNITQVNDIAKYNSIGIGPGIGTSGVVQKMFSDLLEQINFPIVVDADALNILSKEKDLLKKLTANSILTPHPKEFERLAGTSINDFERHELQLRFSKEQNVILVLKGAHTCITTPEGYSFFNSTGNPGMAKGGSGDALTGILVALLAQNYSPIEAAKLGVYIHGLAGDIALKKKGPYSMITSDLIEKLPAAFGNLSDDEN